METATGPGASTADRVMLVTGASRGIGAAIAQRAAHSGWRVGVNYAVSEDAARSVVETVRAAGSDAVAVAADISDPAAAAGMFDTVEQSLGPIRALVCNAGVDAVSAVADASDEEIRRVVSINALGPMWCAREAVRRMSTARGGRGGAIVNVSSIASLFGGIPGNVVYAASKGAVDAFTRGLAKEVADEGIRVCGVRPGLIRTEMWDIDMGQDAAVELGRSAVPMQRIGESGEVAAAVCWLCSDEASYMTGAIVNVSGGRELFVRS